MYSDSQIDGGSQISSSPATPAANRDTFGIVPLTIKQISEASHSGDDKSNFSISGSDVVNVTIVGMVSNIVERNIHSTFTVDDGTGKLDCKRWLNEAHDTFQINQITQGIYVHVDGHLKSYKGERHVDVFSVRPVTNYDEITFHFIACIHNHMRTCKSVEKLQGDVNATPTTPVQSLVSSQQPLHSDASEPSVNAEMVHSYLSLPHNLCIEKGIHVNELSKKLNLPLDKIKESVSALAEEGRAFSTINDDYYKAA